MVPRRNAIASPIRARTRRTNMTAEIRHEIYKLCGLDEIRTAFYEQHGGIPFNEELDKKFVVSEDRIELQRRIDNGQGGNRIHHRHEGEGQGLVCCAITAVNRRYGGLQGVIVMLFVHWAIAASTARAGNPNGGQETVMVDSVHTAKLLLLPRLLMKLLFQI
jgi:hypothetical protein